MSKHQVPQWMNILWLIIVAGLTLSLAGVALYRGYGFIQVLGFLAVNVGLIFLVAVVLGSGLYGLSILLEGVSVHKSRCKSDDDHIRDIANFVP